jgi:hypothetical protein
MRFQHQPEDQTSGNDVDCNIPDQDMVTVDDIPEHVVDSNITDQQNGELPGDHGGAIVCGDRPEGEHMSALRMVNTPNFANCRHYFSRD